MTNTRRILTFYHSLHIGIVEGIILSAIAEMGGSATPAMVALITGHKTKVISSVCRVLGEKGLLTRGELIPKGHRNTSHGARLMRGGGRNWTIELKLLRRLTNLESRAPLPEKIKTDLTKQIQGRTKKRSASPPAGKKST